MISQKPLSPPNEITIDSGAYALLEQSVRRAYPGEACGVLLGERETGTVQAVRSMENRADRRISGRYYKIDPPELYRLECRAEAEGYGIAGFWHSHVNAEAVLSGDDEWYMVPDMVYLIIPVTGAGIGRGRAYRKRTADGEAEEIRFRVKERT